MIYVDTSALVALIVNEPGSAAVRLLPVEPTDVHRAALLTLDAASGIRAGDALHLACAERSGARALVTLDTVMAGNAPRVKLKPLLLGA